MKYMHPNGTRLALLSGHVKLLEPGVWTELDAIFHDEALKKGCHVDQHVLARVQPAPVLDDNGSDGGNPVKPLDEHKAIRVAINLMLQRDEAGDFTGDNNPNVNIVSHLCGFRCTRHQVLEVWKSMAAEAKAEKELKDAAAAAAGASSDAAAGDAPPAE